MEITEAVVRKFSLKQLCLETSHNSQESTRTRDFFNKVAALACNFIKKESLAKVFSCEFSEISKNTFFQRTSQVAASKLIVFKKIKDSLTNFTFSF